TWEINRPREVIRSTGPGAASTTHDKLGDRYWYIRASDGQQVALLFTENETNFGRIDNSPNESPYVKDGVHRAVVEGQADAVNSQQGSKLAGHAHALVPAGGKFSVEVRFSPQPLSKPFEDFDATFAARIRECGTFYDELHPEHLSDDQRLVGRQAFAGLL